MTLARAPWQIKSDLNKTEDAVLRTVERAQQGSAEQTKRALLASGSAKLAEAPAAPAAPALAAPRVAVARRTKESAESDGMQRFLALLPHALAQFVREHGMRNAYQLLCVRVDDVLDAAEDRRDTVIQCLQSTVAVAGTRWRTPDFDCDTRGELRDKIWAKLQHLDADTPDLSAELPVWSDVRAFLPEHSSEAWDNLLFLPLDDDTMRAPSDAGVVVIDSDSLSSSSSDDSDADDERERPAPRAAHCRLSTAIWRTRFAREQAVSTRFLLLLNNRVSLEKAAEALLEPLPVRFTQADGALLDLRAATGGDGYEDGYISDSSTSRSALLLRAGCSRQLQCAAETVYGISVVVAVGPLPGTAPAERLGASHLLLPPAPAPTLHAMRAYERGQRISSWRRLAEHFLEEETPPLSWERVDAGEHARSNPVAMAYRMPLEDAVFRRLSTKQEDELRILAARDTLIMLRLLSESRLLPARIVREVKDYITGTCGGDRVLSLPDELEHLPLLNVLAIARYVRRRYELRFPYTNEWQEKHELCAPQLECAFTLCHDADADVHFLKPSAALLAPGAGVSSERELLDVVGRLTDEALVRSDHTRRKTCVLPFLTCDAPTARQALWCISSCRPLRGPVAQHQLCAARAR